jgi:lipoprotein signal peptidase
MMPAARAQTRPGISTKKPMRPYDAKTSAKRKSSALSATSGTPAPAMTPPAWPANRLGSAGLQHGSRYFIVILMSSFRDARLSPGRFLNSRQPSQDSPGQLRIAGRDDRTSHRGIVLALIAMVIVLDQAAKWWAWRHVRHVVINAGGDALVGSPISAWYSGRITGAALDLLSGALLSIAVWALTSRRVSAVVRVSGALMIGGWSSNLLDRLGFHYWTAPGSVRGVVDFMHIGAHYYNVADFFIIGCTPFFVLAAGYQGSRAAMRALTAGSVAPSARNLARARIPAAQYRESGPRTEQALGWSAAGCDNALRELDTQPPGARY